MTRLEDNIVIVVDTSNYKASYAEKTPFKAKVIDKYPDEISVISMATSKKYHLYYEQILESLPIEEITNLVDLSKYGEKL